MTPYWKSSDGEIHHGNVLDVLKSMPDESVHMCVTSPPYWGLRVYDGIEPQIWDAKKQPGVNFDSKAVWVDCEHVWGDEVKQPSVNEPKERPELTGGGCATWSTSDVTAKPGSGQFCQQCGAWRGSLGLEPDPNLFIRHMVQIFAEVKRVLRSDGTLWLNMGDSYATHGGCKGSKHKHNFRSPEVAEKEGIYMKKPYGKQIGLKEKDLIGVPWRLALALQSDGWWLRSDIIWCLSGGVKVYAKTQKGEMPITLKDLYRLNPETVQLWNGDKWVQLKGMSKSARKGDEIELVLRSGERISCTPNHKWPTNNGLKEAKDLSVGDVLERCFLPDKNRLEYPKHIPNDIGWFIGTYLAEGSRDSGGTIQISSHKKESKRFDKLSRLAENYHGTCRKHDTSENGMTICMESKILNAIIDTYISGRTAKDKHLSNSCWQRDNYFLKFLLMGYLEGDGHWDEINERWRLSFTRNDYFEQDLRTLCSRLHANLTLNLSESSIGYKKYKSYRGEIRFEATVKGHWNQKNKSEIVEIRKARARYFYDVGVEGHTHLFSLASGILTHNSKPNPMPESCRDRPTKSHEYLFLLTKSAKYYYDAEAIREPHKEPWRSGTKENRLMAKGGDGISFSGWDYNSREYNPSGRNKRTVWTIPTQPMPEAHFATFPTKLIEPCILSGSSEKGCCVECGAPWARVVEKGEIISICERGKHDWKSNAVDDGFNYDARWEGKPGRAYESKTIGWQPTCKCVTENFEFPTTESCTVLDPFGGSMTTAIVAHKHGRKFKMIELSQKYIDEIGIPRIKKATKQRKLF